MASNTLAPSSVFVRIRPITETGDCGHTMGEAARKHLSSWDDRSVTMHDADLRQESTTLVTGTVSPEMNQEATFNTMMPDLVESFKNDSNVMLFAYGQTGSGKTHTMLGEIESLSCAEPVPGWGILPRVVHSTLQSMREWQSQGMHCLLLASAVEFYCGAAWDLASANKAEVNLDSDANVFGAKEKVLTSTSQLKKWICKMYANRTTAKTNMNDASSRSHCAFILTLHRLQSDKMYRKTKFSLIDMAGSERHAKTGGERVRLLDAFLEAKKMHEAGTPELLSIGAQGTMINSELTDITTELLKATETHRKGLPYRAKKESSTAASFYFQACFDGRARIGACVTISQSPQHGFESWFALKFAEQMSTCQVPLARVQAMPVDRVLQDAEKAAEEAAEKFSKTNQHPQGAKAWRVFCLLQGARMNTARTYDYLRKLVDSQMGNQTAEEESSEEEVPVPRRLQPKANFIAPEQSSLESGSVNENFAVFIRIRPLNERERRSGGDTCFCVSDIDFPHDPPPQRITVQGSHDADAKGSFVFNRVFEATHGQEDVYNASARPYIADFLAGVNVTLFAYGQTGSGKTHTIAGPDHDPGLITRCLSDVFAGLPTTGKDLYYEYVQLYMEDFKDLLEEKSHGDLKPMDGKDGGVYLRNLCGRKATSLSSVQSALCAGATRRAVRGHDMNSVSSRSHAILILRLVEPGGDASKVVASMFIVDLAGSERISRSGVSGQGFNEATSINQSLTSLGRVVITLLEANSNSRVFVPYNASPLTMLLKVGLGGSSRTALIACVTEAEDSMSESLNTLRFAMQASHVKNKVVRKEARDQAQEEAAKIAHAGNTLVLENGTGKVDLPSGPLVVNGRWESGNERAIILLDHPEGNYLCKRGGMEGLLNALIARHVKVLAPVFTGSSEKLLEQDVEVLLSLFDWLGISQPVIYGRDWGAIRACKFKKTYPKRAATLVLENCADNVTEELYKRLSKADPQFSMRQAGFGTFMWLCDNTYPKSMDAQPGKNMKGFKGKAMFLWPFNSQGRHDPKGRTSGARFASMYAKYVNAKPIDSFNMDDAAVANKISELV